MSLIKSYLHEQMNTFTPNPHLEMLMQREQLMEDIDSICDEFFFEHGSDSHNNYNDLISVLCDSVCKNFPK